MCRCEIVNVASLNLSSTLYSFTLVRQAHYRLRLSTGSCAQDRLKQDLLVGKSNYLVTHVPRANPVALCLFLSGQDHYTGKMVTTIYFYNKVVLSAEN